MTTVLKEIDRLLTHVSDSYQHMLVGSKAYKALRDVASSLETIRAKLKPGLGCLRAPEERRVIQTPAGPLVGEINLIGDRDPYANTHGPIIGLPGQQTDYISVPGDLIDQGMETLLNDAGLPAELNYGRLKSGDVLVPGTVVTDGKLMEAVKKHHADRGNDKCWENDSELYIAAGLEPGDPQLPPLDEHCRMCSRYRKGLYGKDAPDQWISIRLIGGSANYEATPGFGDEEAKTLESYDPHTQPVFVLSMHNIRTKHGAPMMVPAVYDCDWLFAADSDQGRNDAVTWLQNHMETLYFTPTMVVELKRFMNALGRGDKLILYDDYWRTDRIVS